MQELLPRLKPEAISSFELGYRGLLMNSKLLIDAYVYYGQYTNFLARKVVVQSKTRDTIRIGDTTLGQIYSVPINSTASIMSQFSRNSFTAEMRIPAMGLL